MKDISTVKLQNKKSFWRVFYEQYENTIANILTFIIAIGLPFILGLINIKIKVIDVNDEILNFIIGFLSFYLFIIGLILGVYIIYRVISLLYRLLWNIVNFIFKIKAMNRYRHMPLTEDEFELLDIKNIDEFIELIDSYISYEFNFFRKKEKNYLKHINPLDMQQMVKIFIYKSNGLLKDRDAIEGYFLSLIDEYGIELSYLDVDIIIKFGNVVK